MSFDPLLRIKAASVACMSFDPLYVSRLHGCLHELRSILRVKAAPADGDWPGAWSVARGCVALANVGANEQSGIDRVQPMR
jgi:hypothetical protein